MGSIFGMQAEGISPENNFFIQGFMAMSWFMFPASMVVGTVLLNQTERMNKGILKMLALPEYGRLDGYGQHIEKCSHGYGGQKQKAELLCHKKGW